MRLNCLAGLAVLLIASPAAAQEVTLRAASAFAEGTEFSRNFERFIEKVNAVKPRPSGKIMAARELKWRMYVPGDGSRDRPISEVTLHMLGA